MPRSKRMASACQASSGKSLVGNNNAGLVVSSLVRLLLCGESKIWSWDGPAEKELVWYDFGSVDHRADELAHVALLVALPFHVSCMGGRRVVLAFSEHL